MTSQIKITSNITYANYTSKPFKAFFSLLFISNTIHIFTFCFKSNSAIPYATLHRIWYDVALFVSLSVLQTQIMVIVNSGKRFEYTYIISLLYLSLFISQQQEDFFRLFT